jgi:serine/threonine protein kinase
LQFAADALLCPHDGAFLQMASDPLIGTLLEERYRMQSVLGSGGMSVVYKAKHELMDRLVAIKMLKSSLIDQAGAVERFKQEARAQSRLSHPNLAVAFDFGLLSDGKPFLVMDFIPGISLEELLRSEKTLMPARCIEMVHQICQGLAHAHKMGIVHRDLKPSNFLLSGDEKQVKIVDFGLAALSTQEDFDTLKLTQAREVVGTPLYMSPEQVRGREVTAASDIYSLGCVMYEMLTGQPPFVGLDAYETMRKHVFEDPLSMQALNPEVPPELDTIVLRALQKEASQRYQSMEDLSVDLQRLIKTSKSPSIEIAIPADLSHPGKTFTILVVEDVTQMRKHVVALLKDKVPASLRIIEAANGEEALAKFREIRPDMLILDINMPDINGIKVAQQIWATEPQTKILFWSQYHREAYVRELGKIVPDDAVHGYALKSEGDEKLAYAIASILLYDNPYIDPIIRAVQKQLRSETRTLSDEDYEMLVDILVGLSDRAIALRRHISIKGVRGRMEMLQQRITDETVVPPTFEQPMFDPRNRLLTLALSKGLVKSDDIHSAGQELKEWLAEEFDM